MPVSQPRSRSISRSEAWSVWQAIWLATTETVLHWLNRIMSNTFRDDYRARLVRRSVPFDSRLEDCLADKGQTDQPLWRYVDDELVRESIGRLPAPMGRLVELHLAGTSYTEMAQRLEVPMGTVCSRLRRARLRLRGWLLDHEGNGSRGAAAGAARATHPRKGTP